MTLLNKRRMTAIANKGLQNTPYCTVPAVRPLQRMQWPFRGNHNTVHTYTRKQIQYF